MGNVRWNSKYYTTHFVILTLTRVFVLQGRQNASPTRRCANKAHRDTAFRRGRRPDAPRFTAQKQKNNKIFIKHLTSALLCAKVFLFPMKVSEAA